MTQYRLGSSEVVYTPGFIAWAIRNHDAGIQKIVADTWSIPPDAAHALLSGQVPHQIEGDVVVFQC
ncbi:hypothetical protein [Rhizobium arsenicireducens]